MRQLLNRVSLVGRLETELRILRTNGSQESVAFVLGTEFLNYGQKDPKQEYKRESYELFQTMKDRVEDSILKTVFRVEPMTEEQMAAERLRRAEEFKRRFNTATPTAPGQGPAKPRTVVNKGKKVGRNDPCPCGSGKKYKKCHGAKAAAG